MIQLKPPSVVLHSHDVPGYRYKMQVSVSLLKGASPRDVVNGIIDAYDYAPELRNVVINAHGARAKIKVGGLNRLGINICNVDLFSQLADKKIGTIWIVACEVAKGAFGKDFCARMAKASGCNVVASDYEQYVETPSVPFGCIDFYEGSVFRWDSSGSMTTSTSNGAGIPGVA